MVTEWLNDDRIMPQDVIRNNPNREKWINPQQKYMPQIPYTQRLNGTKEDIEITFTEHYGKTGDSIPDGGFKAFLEAIDKLDFKDDFDDIRRVICLCDAEHSEILRYIWANIKDLFARIANPKEHREFIFVNLKEIISFRGRRFAIKNVTFALKQRHVNEAKPLPHSECPSIYIHLDGEKTTRSGRARLAGDQSLMIAKAVDIRNGYPLLLWLMDRFSRKRVEEHKKLWDEHEVDDAFLYPYDEDDFPGNFNVRTWFMHHSLFCKYIQRKCEKLALPMMTAIHALSKRAVPPMNYDCHTADAMIHDDYGQFVEYTKASWEMAYQLSKSSALGSDCHFVDRGVPQTPWLPIQS